jgi:hypothetical protein
LWRPPAQVLRMVDYKKSSQRKPMHLYWIAWECGNGWTDEALRTPEHHTERAET